MAKYDVARGIAAICIGGGEATAWRSSGRARRGRQRLTRVADLPRDAALALDRRCAKHRAAGAVPGLEQDSDAPPLQASSVRARASAAIVLAGAAFAAPDSKPTTAAAAPDSGVVHYLRELCGGDGQLWRERMKELMEAEGSRRAVADAQLQSGIPKLQSHVRHLHPFRADRDRALSRRGHADLRPDEVVSLSARAPPHVRSRGAAH